MKIAIFDTNNHPTPILKEWGYGFLDLNHEVDFYPIEYHSISSCMDKSYDLIVYVGNIDVREFEKLKHNTPNVKIVVAADTMQPHFYQLKGLVEFFITTQHACPTLVNQFKEIEFDLNHIPLAGNNHLFYPIESEKNHDICFIGTLAHGYRGEDKYLYPFIEKYNFFLAGMKYKNYGVPFLEYNQSNEIRNKSKININFHYDYQRLGEGTPADRIDLNQSVYNIALSGGFQICDHHLVSELFGDSIIVADSTEWPELIEYYLHDDNARNNLAKKSYDIAIEKHTWKARMQEFLKILN